MLSKSKLQFILSLQQKKYRKLNNLFIVEGEKLVEELLQSSFRIAAIYATKSWLDEFALKLGPLKDQLYEISESDLKKVSALSTPNKVLALVHPTENNIEIPDLKNFLTLVLDGIKDPGNLGTLIRIADWFGIKNVICSLDTVDLFNPKTIQSTMGSLFRVNVLYTDLTKWIIDYKKTNSNSVYGTLLQGDAIYSKKLNKNGVIIIGSESHGIGETLLPLIDEKIKIPSYNHFENDASEVPNSGAESLNAAIAAAVVIAEFRRPYSTNS